MAFVVSNKSPHAYIVRNLKKMDMEDKSLNFEALMDWKVLNRRSGCPWEFTEEDGS